MKRRLRAGLLALALASGVACGTVRQKPSIAQPIRPLGPPLSSVEDGRGEIPASNVGRTRSPSAPATEQPSGDSKSPARGLPKWNPALWFGNVDDPVPPDWYRPGAPARGVLWQLRNPLHNFTFYVLGVADREFTRCGKFPDAVFAPDGGWNWAVTRCGWLRLPFLSFNGERWRCYFGWRERGNFGGKINFGRRTANPAPPPK